MTKKQPSLKKKELTVEGLTIDEWAKKNKWIECENGCCLFDPQFGMDFECMAKTKSKGKLST